jgi:hypothetical protein
MLRATLSRRPVGVDARTVNASLGQGSRQWWFAGAVNSTSQPLTEASGMRAAAGVARDAPPAEPAHAVTTTITDSAAGSL